MKKRLIYTIILFLTLTISTGCGWILDGGEFTYSSYKRMGKPSHLVIPKGYSTIKGFLPTSYLKSIEFPNTVTNIDKSAFSGCINLELVTIPSSVTSIGAKAFDSGIYTKVRIKVSKSSPVYNQLVKEYGIKSIVKN